MEILNIGFPELILLLLLGFLVLGPGEIAGTARKLGTWMRKVTNSTIWKDIVSTSNEIRDLPNKLIREADLENEILEVKQFASTNSILNDDVLKISKEINGELVDPEVKLEKGETK